MRLLIKQRVFSWSDSYDVYDENGNRKYFVKGEIFSLGHKLHVYDNNNYEIGVIKQRLLTFTPAFEIEVAGATIGTIQKKISFFRPKYNIDFNGWNVEGDFIGWNYSVFSNNNLIMHISKQWLHWGDTYVIDINNPNDEFMGLMLVIAIDAANCSNDD